MSFEDIKPGLIIGLICMVIAYVGLIIIELRYKSFPESIRSRLVKEFYLIVLILGMIACNIYILISFLFP